MACVAMRRIAGKRSRSAASAGSAPGPGSLPPPAAKLRKRPAGAVSDTWEVDAAAVTPPPGVKARLEWRRADERRRLELELMRELRRWRDAPVDTLGTEALGDRDAPEEVRAFHMLVAVFLSSQTRDETVAAAVGRLKQGLPGGLAVSSVERAGEAKIAQLIKPVAFYNIKAANMKRIARVLAKDYAGKVPTNADELCALPGVGPKMAHIAITAITKTPQGIGIDVHVHRICNQLGWVESKDPEQTRRQLESWLPYSAWSDVNLLMVGLGQQLQTAGAVLLRRCFEVPQPVSTLRLLHKLGLDFGRRDKRTGQNVLHWAAEAGDAEALRALLSLQGPGLKPVRDVEGRWPWDSAAEGAGGPVGVMLLRHSGRRGGAKNGDGAR